LANCPVEVRILPLQPPKSNALVLNEGIFHFRKRGKLAFLSERELKMEGAKRLH
jgi:hypothetical protein